MSESDFSGRGLIGVVGGMGPRAGLDLVSRILTETVAERDQDHVPFVLFSMPGELPDRTGFLLGRTGVNPGPAIARQLDRMAEMGVTVAAIACNTAHARPIFESLNEARRRSDAPLLLHLIDETAAFLRGALPSARLVGVLATPGTYRFRLYDDRLEQAGFEVIRPGNEVAAELSEAISNPEWGIKGRSSPVTERARDCVRRAVLNVIARGADTVVLGCTELPLAISDEDSFRVPLVDPGTIMARSLIRHACPERLRPLEAGAGAAGNATSGFGPET